jgi:CheY-like chemotaxis protein
MSRILIMDDDPLIRAAIEATLVQEGHSVVCAANGFEGEDSMWTQHFDIAIIDMFMPGQDVIAHLPLAGRAHWGTMG